MTSKDSVVLYVICRQLISSSILQMSYLDQLQPFITSVRGHPISHFCCSELHSASKLELHSTLLFESELHSIPIPELHSTLKSELW